MIMNLEAVYTSTAFVGYIEKKIKELGEHLELEALFPVKRVEGMDYSYIKTTNGAIELTAPSAFDAEPIAQQRKGFDAMAGDLPLFRRKMLLSEKERQKLMVALQTGKEERVKAVLREIYDDQMTLVTGGRMTMEFLRSRVLMDGKITIASKGGAVNFDYKVPVGHKKTLSSTNEKWDSPEAKIIDNVRDWCDQIEEETGIRPDAMIMNRKTFKYLRTNKQLKDNLLPVSILATASVANSQYFSDDLLLASFKALTGLKEVKVYNAKVAMDGTNFDLIEDKKVTLYPSSMLLGNTLVGVSPAEFNAQNIANAGNEISVTGDGIAVSTVIKTEAPYTSSTFAEFIAVPSFPASDFVVQATVA